jgi:hypothetical protein
MSLCKTLCSAHGIPRGCPEDARGMPGGMPGECPGDFKTPFQKNHALAQDRENNTSLDNVKERSSKYYLLLPAAVSSCKQ